jgi:hypothetical protein
VDSIPWNTPGLTLQLAYVRLQIIPWLRNANIRVVHFLVIVGAAGGHYDLLGASLRPLLAALSAFDDGFGLCSTAVVGGRFPIA